MRNLKVLAIIATSTLAAESGPSSSNAVSTSFVTAPTSPLNKTIFFSANATQTLSATEGLISSKPKNEGLYSFIDKNGTTVWLGDKTPPAFAKFKVQTTKVHLQPIPQASISKGPSTFYRTKDVTETVFASVGTGLVPKKPFQGPGTDGWNFTTFSTVKIESMPTIKPTVSAYDKHVKLNGTACPEPKATAPSKYRVAARAIGDVVFAEVDGVTVSWTNEYDGLSTSATTWKVAEASPSVFELPAYPWDVAPNPEPQSKSHPVATTSYAWSKGSKPAADESTTVSTSIVSSVIFPNTTRSFPTSPSSQKTSSCPQAPAEFTVDFDGLPQYSLSSDSSDSDIPPIFNPYNKLYWQGHFGYVPPPSDPFPPKSPPQLAVCRAHGPEPEGSPDAGLELPGEFGAGPHAPYSAFWIDADSVWLGCADGGHVGCNIVIYGYAHGSDQPLISQTLVLPTCPKLKACQLTLVYFDDGFKALSGIQIISSIGGQFVDYYMDDLKLSWSDNSCSAQKLRGSTH